MGAESVDDIKSPYLREKLRAEGYAYADDETESFSMEPPERKGWYISLDDEGKPWRLRLTDEPFDGLHLRTDVHTIEAVTDEYHTD